MFLPHKEFWPFLGPTSLLTFHNVNNDGQSILGSGGAGGGTTEKKDRKEQNNIVRVFLVKTSPAEGRRRFHKNTAYARLGV